MRALRFSAAFLAAACLHVSASAQTDQPRARAFVDQISLASTANERLPRWDSNICVGAVGLGASEAQSLVDRISARAASVGLRPGAPGCRANVMVIYAPDADTLTRQIVEERRDLLGYYGENGQATPGREAMAEFANTSRPVRWWHVSDTGAGSIRPDAERSRRSTDQSAALAAASGSPDAGRGSLNDLDGADAVRVSGTRARPELRNDLSYVLIVVDAPRVAGAPASAWMDYVALVALAQINPDARPADFPTILNLFSAPQSAPTALTEWDVAYLEGLYRGRNTVAGNRQANDIANRIARNVNQ